MNSLYRWYIPKAMYCSWGNFGVKKISDAQWCPKIKLSKYFSQRIKNAMYSMTAAVEEDKLLQIVCPFHC